MGGTKAAQLAQNKFSTGEPPPPSHKQPGDGEQWAVPSGALPVPNGHKGCTVGKVEAETIYLTQARTPGLQLTFEKIC